MSRNNETVAAAPPHYTDTSHIWEEVRCECGHERGFHSHDGSVCWSNERPSTCECPGFVECDHSKTVPVERAGGDIMGGSVGVDVITERCLSCGELSSE